MCLAIGLFSVSCKKKAADVSTDYVGYWIKSSGGGSLMIDSDSKAVYENSSGTASVTVRGKARVKGNTLKIAVKKFTIDQKPTAGTSPLTMSTTTIMVLDGETYEKF